MAVINVRRKMPDMLAVQWTGKNIDEIKRFIDIYGKVDEKNKLVKVGGVGQARIATVNCFIIKTGEDTFSVVSEKQFTQLFEEVI